MRCVWAGPSRPDLDAALAAWIASRIFPTGRDLPSPRVCVGVFDTAGALAGAVAYFNWDPEAGVIEWAGASAHRRWLSRDVLWEMFSYPFHRLGCQMVVARNDPDDAPLRRMEEAYGFTALRIPRMRGRESDELLMMLTDDAWRANGWHKEKRHGR